MNTRTNTRVNLRQLFFAAAFVFVLMMFIGKAKADPTDYIYSNYGGVANSNTTMYTQPGSEKPPVLDPDGNPLRVPQGTEVFITGEQKDKDLDVWYQSKITINGIEYEGFLYSGRINRGEKIEFTPTPTPVPTDTPVPEVTEAVNPEPAETTTTVAPSADNSDLIDQSKGLGPWKWIIILVIVIVVFMLIYTIWVKKNEERLEREIERYSGKQTYQRIDGESDEDFAEAKSNYYDSIHFGDQSNKDLADEINGIKKDEDISIDMTGMFDGEDEGSKKRKTRINEDATLTELLADLEGRIAKGKKDAAPASEEYDEDEEIVDEELYEDDLYEEGEAEEESDDDFTEEEIEEAEEELEDEISDEEYEDEEIEESDSDESDDSDFEETSEDYAEDDEEYEDDSEYEEDDAEYDEEEYEEAEELEEEDIVDDSDDFEEEAEEYEDEEFEDEEIEDEEFEDDEFEDEEELEYEDEELEDEEFEEEEPEEEPEEPAPERKAVPEKKAVPAPEKKPVDNAKAAQKPDDKKKSRYSDIFDDAEVKPKVKMSPRDYLDNLNENDTLVHKVYGEGVVVDNFSPDVIQVDFGGNIKYLKKDKLIRKDLISY